MNIIPVNVSDEKIQLLEIGYQGENEVTEVDFDVTSWKNEFGSGTAVLYIKRKGDGEPYYVNIPIETEDTKEIAKWLVDDTDTAAKGRGSAQLRYYVSDVLKKTVVYPFKVAKSLMPNSPAVEPYDDWLENIEQYRSDSEAYAVGTRFLVSVDEDDVAYHNNAKFYAEQLGDAIQDDVYTWLVAHPEATTTVQDGAVTEAKLGTQLKYKVNRQAFINVASLVGGTLTSANIADAILDALDYSKYIYIPDGNYTFNLSLDSDCTILMDDECYIATDNQTPCIYADGCSVNIYGGNVCAGQDDASREPVFGSYSITPKGIIVFENCTNCHVSGVKTPYSKYSGVYYIKDCDQMVFENLALNNILFNGIRVLNHCSNVIVRNCSFTNIDMMLNGTLTANVDYCYAVSTGATELSATFTPPDNILFENNYVYDSEDCGLDTHGATNVTIRNNTVLECVCSITAYNDNARVTRPTGWRMANILIENNYCVSSKDNTPGRSYPHPFIFLGASNNHKDTDSGYESNPGNYYSYTNCVVRNNYFKSPNSCENGGVIYLNKTTRDVIVENNYVDCCNANKPIQFVRSINFALKNNTFVNASGNTQKILFAGSCGIIENNVGGFFDYSSSYVSYVKGGRGDISSLRSQLVAFGDFTYMSNQLHAVTSIGRSLRSDETAFTFSITVADGIATCTETKVVPQTALVLDGTDAVYVVDVIDMTHFSLLTTSYQTVPDGSYTAAVRTASTVAITS